MTDNLKNIRAIEEKYGLPLFGMALTHLVDVGVRNMTNENAEEHVKRIMADGAAAETEGARLFMRPEFQCAIVRCAAELAKFSIWELFAYIKRHLAIGGA